MTPRLGAFGRVGVGRHAVVQTSRMAEHPSNVTHRDAGPAESARANRRWWDAEARTYQDEHGDFLGDDDLLWCPEGLREADARLLGDVRDRDVLEVGCGAAQGARWLVREGARVTAFDVSYGQLLESRRLDERSGTDGRAASCRPTRSTCPSATRPSTSW